MTGGTSVLGTFLAGAALLGSGAALSGCETDAIVITPAVPMTGQLLNPQGQPYASGTEIDLYLLDGSKLEKEVATAFTDDQGFFEIDFPRHATYSAKYILVAPSAEKFPLYGFTTVANPVIDLVQTGIFDLISLSPAQVNAFSVEQITDLLNQAYATVKGNIQTGLLDPTAPNVTAKQLRKAYRNAISANLALVGAFQDYALTTNVNTVGLLPYNTLNTIPAITANTPRIASPSVAEASTLALTIQAQDYDGDYEFYTWSVDGVEQMRGDYKWNYVPAYTTVPWDQAYGIHTVKVTASDGGLASTQVWNAIVANVERAPVFTSTKPLTGTEDQLWTYTPTAMSPDGAPFDLSLVAGQVPAGMDMCLASTMLWQFAGTPCVQAGLIQWTPTNCQSTSSQTVQIQAIDADSAKGVQSFSVAVHEINDAPTITSNPGSLVAQEASLWSYQPLVTDPQADPAAQPGIVSGSDPSPFSYLPGGVGCPDTMTFSFIQSPSSATIDPASGIINWTPLDGETGNQKFTVLADDGHGGTTTQAFTVVTQNMEQPPAFNVPSDGATLTVDEELFTIVPYTFSVTVTDPDLDDQTTTNLSLQATGLPPGMTQGPATGATNGATWGFSWAVNDTMTPGNWPVTLTACDTNPNNRALVASYPANVAPIAPGGSPPNAHFCTTINITIDAPKRNIAPKFVSAPPTLVKGGQVYTYNIQVFDGNTNPADTLTYSILTGPPGMTITPGSTTAPNGTATLSWSPANAAPDLGTHAVQIQVLDSNGSPAPPGYTPVKQTFSVFVQETNSPPNAFAIAPPTTGQDGALYTTTATTTDPNTTAPNNQLTYSLPVAPSGMVIDPNTGVITWTPTVAQAIAGSANVTVQATDGGTPAYSVSYSWAINLTYVNLAPIWNAVADPTVAILNPYSLNVVATDPDGDPITLSATGVPSGATFVDNGGGVGTFTWTPTVASVTSVTFNAADDHAHVTPMVVHITAVDGPLFISHPVLAANSNGQYVYEVHCLDPAGGGIAYSFDTAPNGMTVKTIAGVTQVTWTPATIQVGPNIVILRATDIHGTTAKQNYTVLASSGADAPPNILSTNPSAGGLVTLTEGKQKVLTATANDPENDSLHYAWYLDAIWLDDTGSSYTILPSNVAAGDHTMRLDVTDGSHVVSATYASVHVRDAVPVLGSNYTLPSGSLNQFVLVPSAGSIVTTRGGGSPGFDVFSEANVATAPTSTSLPFAPGRVVIENDLVPATNLFVYLSQNGAINAGGNTYETVSTSGMSTSGCSALVCFPKMFDSAYVNLVSSGTNQVYLSSTNTVYYINPADRTKLGSYTAGSANADAPLGATVSASSLVYDSVDAQLYVSVPNLDEILAINPATRAVTATISLPGASGPTALYFNALSKKLYSYNTGNGTVSEISGPTNTLLTTTNGLPAGPSILNDPPHILDGGDADNVLYIASLDSQKIVTFDIDNGTSRTLAVPSGPNQVAFDSSAKLLFGASYGGNQVFRLQ